MERIKIRLSLEALCGQSGAAVWLGVPYGAYAGLPTQQNRTKQCFYGIGQVWTIKRIHAIDIFRISAVRTARREGEEIMIKACRVFISFSVRMVRFRPRIGPPAATLFSYFFSSHVSPMDGARREGGQNPFPDT